MSKIDQLGFKSRRLLSALTLMAMGITANAHDGGRLLLGIEDGQDGPPAGQHIPADLPDTVRRKLAERTVTGPMNQRLLSTMDDRNGAYYRLPTYAFGQSSRQPKHPFGQFGLNL